MSDIGVPDGWELRDDGLPYPVGMALDSNGEPYEASGYYALLHVLTEAGIPESYAEAWNALMGLRRLGFDVEWVAFPGYTPRPLGPIDDYGPILDSREERSRLLAYLFELWDQWDTTTSRARAAHALAKFDEMWEHYRWQLRIEGILEPEVDE